MLTAALAAGLAASVSLALFLALKNRRLRVQRARLEEARQALARENAGLQARLEARDALLAELERRHEDLAAKLAEGMRGAADRLLLEQSRRLRQAHEDGLGGLLEPLRREIERFQERLQALGVQGQRDHAELRAELGQLRRLNERLGEEARILSRALRGDTKAQGGWGEMVLERLLEVAGLERGREFDVQPHFTDGRGRGKRPDVVIRLPRERDLVVDAKVSLTHFTSYLACEDEAEGRRLLALHARSLRRHMEGLAAKDYQRLPQLRTVDLVLLFVPVEAALQAAVAEDPDLLVDGYRRGVLPVSPGTLLPVLRLVEHLWREERLSRHAFTLAKQAADLYDKFVGVVTALEEVGQRISQAQTAWETVRNRFWRGRGNLVSQVERLRGQGVQPRKQLPKRVLEEALPGSGEDDPPAHQP